MPIEERSAGVIVFRPGPPRQYLLLDYGRHWDYPKGHLEPGESPLAAAVRELQEETGITSATLLPGFAREIRYFFRDKSKSALIAKSVVFYLAQAGAEDIRLSHEHVGFSFETFDSAQKKLTYPSARQVLRDAEAFLLTRG